MEIENSAFVIKDKKRLYIFSIILAIIIPLVLFSDWFYNLGDGTPRYWITAFVVFIYILYYIYRIYLNYNYIQATIESDKLIIRYYSLRPFTKIHRTIEIPINTFEGFKIEKKFYGRKNELILFQKIKGKIAKYPSISLSGLDKQQQEQMSALLNSIIHHD
jgi:hypothetical protein